MAETLGSLIDKLTIKTLRQYHLQKSLQSSRKTGFRKRFSKSELKKKLKFVRVQKNDLLREINSFIVAAINGKVKLREEKFKLYNAPYDIGRIPKLDTLGQAISALAQKNAHLWSLEDEARRKDVSDAYIGKIKRKIDFANQQRNDLIDALDEILEKCLKRAKASL